MTLDHVAFVAWVAVVLALIVRAVRWHLPGLLRSRVVKQAGRARRAPTC